MREAYRLNKSLIPSTAPIMSIGLIYVSSDLMEFSEIQIKVILALKKLASIVSENQEKHHEI